jgi:hypothetical protein
MQSDVPADATPAELFAAHPWRGLTHPELDAALAIPSMLSPEEAQLYFWLARDWSQNAGATVDLGTFAGGSAARLAAGHRAAGRGTPVIAYDQFTADETTKQRFLYPAGVAPFKGNDILLLAHRMLTPWKPAVELRAGDILEQAWTSGPIELLVIDAAKSTALADHIAAEFFPALIPGRSIVVQQDFLHRVQPWLAAQMFLLSDFFTPVARVPRDCMVFLCTRTPTPAAIAAARTETLDDAALVRLVRRAARLYQPLAGRYWFANMVRKLRANPGERTAWKMWRE